MDGKETDKTTVDDATKGPEPPVDVDKIWLALGQYGRYQVTQLLVLLVAVWSCGFHMLSIVFIGFRPNYECEHTLNLSAISTNITDVKVEHGKCSVTSRFNTSGILTTNESECSSGWNYTYRTNKDFPTERSFVSEWNLVCSRGEIPELTQTLMMLGQGFGAFIFTSLSDKFGRKPTCVFCHIGLFLVTLATSFVPNYGAFIVMRILTGSLQQGVTLTLTILNLEMFPAKIRSIVEVLGLLFWSTGIALITPLAYALRTTSWRYLQICLACLSSWSLIQWWLTDESIRWLIANGKYDQAKQIIMKACKLNKKDYVEVMKESGFQQFEMKSTMMQISGNTDIVKQDQEGQKLVRNGDMGVNKETDNSEVKKYTVINLVKSKRLFFTSLIMWFAWITNSLTYYGIMLLSSSLAGNRFLNFFLGSAVEYPAALLEYLLFDRCGRKVACITFHSICCVSLIVATILTTLAGGSSAMLLGSTVCTLIGKFAITGSFSTLFLYTPELYPTNMRNVGIGMASAAARIGAMIAPFSRNLAEVSIWAPGLIYGIMCAIVSISMFWVPETNQRELPQTLAETEVWYRDNRFRLSRRKEKMSNDKEISK